MLLLLYISVSYDIKKGFHNSLEMIITKDCLFGDKLTIKVVICNSLHVLGNGATCQETHACFSSAFTVHEAMPKVGQHLKDYWLKKFPQECCP